VRKLVLTLAALSVACGLGLEGAMVTGSTIGGGGDGGVTGPGDGALTDPDGAPVPPADPDAAPRPDGATVPGRVTSGLVALYDLEEPSGTVAHDAIAPYLDLTVPIAATHVKGGVAISAASGWLSSIVPATKIATRCTSTGEITLEAWVRYGALTAWSRIVAFSATADVGNIALTSDPTTVGFDLRTTDNAYQRDTLQTFASVPTGQMKHFVLVRDQAGDKTLVLDGQTKITVTQGGDLSGWDSSSPLSVGNTPANDRQFTGEIHLVAVYDRALGMSEILQNYNAGPDPP
jgi:hypothetical protein